MAISLSMHLQHEAQAPEHMLMPASLHAQAIFVLIDGYTAQAGTRGAPASPAALTRMQGSVRTAAVLPSCDAPSRSAAERGAAHTCQKPAVLAPRTRDSRNATATCRMSGSTAGGATVAGHWITNSAQRVAWHRQCLRLELRLTHFAGDSTAGRAVTTACSAAVATGAPSSRRPICGHPLGCCIECAVQHLLTPMLALNMYCIHAASVMKR